MARTYKSIVINVDGGSGTSSPAYSESFNNTSSWSLNGSVYELTVLQSTHDQGANVVVQAFELVSTIFREVEVDVVVNGTGDVTIEVTASPDLRFSGKIIIKGD